MLRIHDFKGFPNPARARIALAKKRLTDKVEFVSVDVPDDLANLRAWRERVAARPSVAHA
jgi:glutathione S-transferase